MDIVDVCIIGQGPAGLSAAIYTARAGLSTRLLGCEPKIAGEYTIDNYFGFPEPISGRALIERGVRQAARFGAVVECDKVLGLHMVNDGRIGVKTEKRSLTATAIILATGIQRKRPPIQNSERFEGRGVSYCVSCDGHFFRNKRIMVVGGGNFAANQALELLEYSPAVTLCTMGEPSSMTVGFEASLADSGVVVIERPIVALNGDAALASVLFDNGVEEPVDGLFFAVGDASSSDFAKSLGIIVSEKFIAVDENQRTNIPGVFAAGDCTGRFLQISVAVGEGAIAARAAIAHVRERRRAIP